MKRVRIANLVAARRRDSRATVSGTPSSSNKMLPGRTVATQYSGAPLPLPIRVSGGREVTDLSGKMRIQSLPLRFMLRVRATRAASICVLVIHARSRVCRPNSPKSIRMLREANPERLPRCDFLYLTLLGINGMAMSPWLGGGFGGRGGRGGFLSLLLRKRFLGFTDPAFHPDLSIHGVRLGEAVVYGDAQGVQRDFPLAIPFRARDFRAAETARATYLDALRAEIHRGLDGLLHGAAEGDAALDLEGNILGDELGVEFRGLDFLDVDLDLLAGGHLADLLGHLLDLRALAPDDDAGPGGEDGDADAVPRALDDDLRHRGELELFLHVTANFEVRVEELGQFLGGGEPARTPVAAQRQTEPDRINFLTHDLLFFRGVFFALRRCRAARFPGGFRRLPGLPG